MVLNLQSPDDLHSVELFQPYILPTSLTVSESHELLRLIKLMSPSTHEILLSTVMSNFLSEPILHLKKKNYFILKLWALSLSLSLSLLYIYIYIYNHYHHYYPSRTASMDFSNSLSLSLSISPSRPSLPAGLPTYIQRGCGKCLDGWPTLARLCVGIYQKTSQYGALPLKQCSACKFVLLGFFLRWEISGRTAVIVSYNIGFRICFKSL